MANGFRYFSWQYSARIVVSLAAGALVLLSGCEKNEREEGPVASASVAPAPRPETLALAISEIKGGRPADAQPRLEAFLEQQPDSVYVCEAHYLLGQSLAAQGQHEAGKGHLEKVIDDTKDRNLKALAMLGRADCNMAMNKFQLASRQYHWLETMYRDIQSIPQDELMYKLGLATKKAGATETADYWFKQVINLYATGPYAADARREHSAFNPSEEGVAPRVYTLEVTYYSKREKADEEAGALRDKGYRDVQVIETTRNSFPVYEVHVGKFGNKTDAIRAQTDAELAGLPTTIRPAIIEPLK